MFVPTRRAICATLESQLQAHSMDRITVSMVCADAGISRQTLYNYDYSLLDVLSDLLLDKLNGGRGRQRHVPNVGTGL